MPFRQTYHWRSALRGALLLALLAGIDGGGTPTEGEPPSTEVEVRLARDLAGVSSLSEASELLKRIRLR